MLKLWHNYTHLTSSPFNSTWTVKYQMFKLNLEKAEEQEINLPTSMGSSKNQECSRKTSAAAKSLQLCPTLCSPINGSPPGSPVPGILQARTLEWAASSFSMGKEKHLLLLYWLHQSLWLCRSQQTLENSSTDGNTGHLTCLLRNLHAGQEATVRTGHGTTDWFQIGKGICQGWSPCLFNLYAEYTMQNARLDEA